MMKITALVEALVSAGASPEMILAAVRSTEAQVTEEAEVGKEKARARWRRWRENHPRTNEEQRLQTLANDGQRLTGGAAPVEDKTSNLEIEPQKEEKKDAPARDLSDFKAEFIDLDPERLSALIKHRRAKHGQITGHAARLFRQAAIGCGLSISQAVDTCIDRNWITLKPDWLNRPQARGSPPAKPDTTTDVAQRLLAEMRSANGQPGTSSERHHQALVAIPGGKYAGHSG